MMLRKLILWYGLSAMAIGTLVQMVSPTIDVTLDEQGKVLSQIEPPARLYVAAIIVAAGMIATVLGFALVIRREATLRED